MKTLARCVSRFALRSIRISGLFRISPVLPVLSSVEGSGVEGCFVLPMCLLSEPLLDVAKLSEHG
jgi:hypothetical protein